MAVIYKMSDVYSLCEEFKDKFNPVMKIDSGEKLMIVDGRLVKDPNSPYLQSFSRWWENQNRYDIVSLLEKQAEGYLGLLKFVYGAHKASKTAPREKKQLLNIYKQHKIIIGDIVTGLSLMKDTYANSEDVASRIQIIIDDLRYLP
jgi:hypothetical protein